MDAGKSQSAAVAAEMASYEEGATGTAGGMLVEIRTATHEEINVYSKPGPSRAAVAHYTDQGLTPTMQPLEFNLERQKMSNIAVGVEAGRDVVVHGPMTVTVSPSMTPAPPVKSFRNVSAPIKAFQGRENFIKLIHKELVRKSTLSHWSDRTLALVGLGGMGKTELARKFAEVHDQTYPNVAWINAETEKSITESFQNLAQTLQLPCNATHTGREVAESVYCHVGQHVHSALFIFDNATQLHSENGSFGILNYFPRQTYKNQPFCLVTTQSMDWDAQDIDTLEVQELTKEESIRFLIQRFKLSPADLQNESLKGETLVSLMEQLHEYVQGYPLALQLAAASVNYMPNKDTTSFLQNRLEIFLGKKLKELDAKSVLDKSVNAGGSDYDRTLRIIWGVLMEKIEKDEYSAEGLHLLKILAYTDPDGTPCKDLEAVYNVSFAAESKADEQSPFESVLHLLQKLVIVQVYKGLKTEWYTRMHRMVQFLARRDDSEGNGLRYIIQSRNSELLQYFFTSQLQLFMPPSMLCSDELVIAWLRSVVEIAICWGLKPNMKALVFDSTHEEQLRERHCASIDDILATVDLVRKLMSAQWKENGEAEICGLIDFARNLKRDSELFGSLWEITAGVMRRTLRASSEKETIKIKLKEWLLHPDTTFALPPGQEQQFLVFTVGEYLESEIGTAIFNKLLSGLPDIPSIFVPDLLRDIFANNRRNFEKAFEMINTDSDIYLKCWHVRTLLSHHKLAYRLITEPNLNLLLKKSLESTQARFHAKYKQLFEKRDVVGIRNLTSDRMEPRPIPESDMDEADKNNGLDLYVGYVTFYLLALSDYDLTGENFTEKLGKWLPSFEYLSKGPLCLELVTGRCQTSTNHLWKLCLWKMEDDMVILNRVLGEICDKDDADPAAATPHVALVQALKKYRQGLPEFASKEAITNRRDASNSKGEAADYFVYLKATKVLGDFKTETSHIFTWVKILLNDPKQIWFIAKLIVDSNLNVQMKEMLQLVQAGLHAKWNIKLTKGAFGRFALNLRSRIDKFIIRVNSLLRNEGSSRRRNPRVTCGEQVAFEFETPEEIQANDTREVVGIYMGYVICYSLAVSDYDLTGGRFSKKLKKWLPPSKYLNKGPLSLELVSNEFRYRLDLYLRLYVWKKVDDTPILDRVLREIREQDELDGASASTHMSLIQALQQFRSKLPDLAELQEMFESVSIILESEAEPGVAFSILKERFSSDMILTRQMNG